MFKYGLLFTASLVAGWILTPWVRRLALYFGAVDLPGEERRVHQHATPRLGGLAIYGSLVSAFAVAAGVDRFISSTLYGHDWNLLAFGFGATVVLLVGIVDDVRSLTPLAKLIVQILAAGVVVLSGYQIDRLGGLDLGFFAVPLTIAWVIVVTNAFNLIDGLDGLSAGIGVIVSATLLTICIYTDDVTGALVLSATLGALVGFLRYNFYPARIFLGDSGSLLLGFILAVVSLRASNRPSAVAGILVPIVLLGLPLLETGFTVLRRLLNVVGVERHERESTRYDFVVKGRATIFSSDRGHIHHKLLDFGIDHRSVVLLLYAICAGLCLVAVLIVVARTPDLGLLLVAFTIVSVIAVSRLGYAETRVLKNGVLLPFFELPLVNRRFLHVLVDLAFIVGSLVAATIVAGDGNLALKDAVLGRAPIVAAVQMTALWAAGVYRRSYRYTGIGDLFAVTRGLVLAVAGTIVALRVLRGAFPPAAFWMLDGYFLASLVVGARISFRILEHVFAAEREGGARILLYGAGKGGTTALREIRENPALGMTAIGFLDDAPAKRGIVMNGCPVFGAEDLELLIRDRRFDELVIASSKIDETRLRGVAERCAGAGIGVRQLSIGWQELPNQAEVSAKEATQT